MSDRRILIRPRAAADVVEIFKTIWADDRAAAARFEASVQRECGLLQAFPHLGRVRGFSSQSLEGVRSRPLSGFRSWLLFYRVHPDAIEVIRVLHGARDLPAVLGDTTSP